MFTVPRRMKVKNGEPWHPEAGWVLMYPVHSEAVVVFRADRLDMGR